MFGIIDIVALVVEMTSEFLSLLRAISASLRWILRLIQSIPCSHGLRAVPITAKCSDRFPDL